MLNIRITKVNKHDKDLQVDSDFIHKHIQPFYCDSRLV